MPRFFVDSISEDEHGVRIASLSPRDRRSRAFTMPADNLPRGVVEGDSLEGVFFRRYNSADLEAVRRLMEGLSQ